MSFIQFLHVFLRITPHPHWEELGVALLVIAGFSVFVDIKSFFLYAFVNAQTMQFLDAIEQCESAGSSPEVDHEDTEAFCTEESLAETIERTIGCGQQTRHQGTQDTTYSMYRRSTYWIVDVQLVVNELDGINQYSTAYKADDDGSDR